MKFSRLVGLVALLIVLALLWRIRRILLLSFTAIALATVMNRVVQQFRRGGISRRWAVPLAICTILLAVGLLLAFLLPSLVGQGQQFGEDFPSLVEQLRRWYGQLQEFLPQRVLRDIGSLNELFSQIVAAQNNLIDRFVNLASNSLDIVLNLLLVVAVTIMLLANPQAYRHLFLLAFPRFYRDRVDKILDECETALGGWIVGILFNMTVIAVMSGLGLWLLGIPFPLVNAVIAGLLTFIPNLGPTLSVIPPTLLALTVTPWKAIAVVVLYIVIQQVESNILTPLVMKREVSLLPAITLLAQIIFAALFGILGLFLALPLLVVVQVWLREVLVEDILNTWETPH